MKIIITTKNNSRHVTISDISHNSEFGTDFDYKIKTIDADLTGNHADDDAVIEYLVYRACTRVSDIIITDCKQFASKTQLVKELKKRSARVQQAANSASIQRGANLLKLFENRELSEARDRAEARRQQHELLLPAIRRAAQATLRRHGFKLVRSAGGSNYYERGTNFTDNPRISIRISNHDVPMSAERSYNSANGGFSWADSGNSYNINEFDNPDEIVKSLEEIFKEE